MKVTLIAQTVLSVDEAIRASGYQWQEHPDATGYCRTCRRERNRARRAAR